jgi:hypothetical protein
VPVIPNGGWRTPLLIDNRNKKLTIYTDDADYVGFTLKFDLIVTVPKVPIANRGLYSFYITFLDATCLNAAYDTPVVTHTTSYTIGDDAASFAVPSNFDTSVCRTNGNNLLSLAETHTELKVLPPRHRPFRFHFEEQNRTLHWETLFID